MLYKAYILPRLEYCSKLLLGINKTLNKNLNLQYYNIVIPIINSVTSVNLKNAGMASRNIVMKKQYTSLDLDTCFGSEL